MGRGAHGGHGLRFDEIPENVVKQIEAALRQTPRNFTNATPSPRGGVRPQYCSPPQYSRQAERPWGVRCSYGR